MEIMMDLPQDLLKLKEEVKAMEGDIQAVVQLLMEEVKEVVVVQDMELDLQEVMLEG